MMRVLTCLGMVSVLLLTSFVTNVYAAEDFPTYNEVKITVSGIPGQTSESVTDVDLTPSPCSAQNEITCTGFSDIAIPGIGDGHLLVILHNHKAQGPEHHVLSAAILVIVAVGLALEPLLLKTAAAAIIGANGAATVPITGHDISGLVTIQLS
jgi:hypothetical protein